MKFKKILFSLLAAAISVSSISAASAADFTTVKETVEKKYQSSDDGFLGDDFEYTELDDGTLAVTCDNKSITDAVIPETVNDKKVTSIGAYAFNECTSLTSVTIPSSVTSIGNSAFRTCTGLTSVTIPSSVTSMGDSAFRGCTSLTSVTLSSGVSSIGNVTFYDCINLTSVTIPSSVSSIGRYVFGGCTSLTSISIPSSVTSIESGVFEGCTSLTSISIPSSVTSIESSVFSGCTSLKSVTIPSGVTKINANTFKGCTSLTSVKIPSSVTSIGYMAFYRCTSLKSVTIPNGVTSISSSVFDGCTSLTAINADSENKDFCSVGGVLFNKDKTELIQYPMGKTAKSYTIPGGVTSIGGSAFEGCTNLVSVTIPGSVTEIDWFAFDGCTSLTSVTIPSSVTQIGNHAFRGCTSLTAINVDAANEDYSSVDGVLFDEDRYKLIQYPAGKTAKSYTIPGSVGIIDDSAFKDCTSLKSITIPSNVKNICSSAFEGCTNLTSVKLPSSVTYIGNSVFSGCTSLKSVTIPSSVTRIDMDAFKGCTSLKSVTIPNGVTSIDMDAFKGCTGLTSVMIPSSMTSIGTDAFSDSGIKYVYYTGTTAQWEAISKSLSRLDKATVYCNFRSKVASVNSTVTNSSVKLTWNKFEPASYYKIWVQQDGAWKLLKKTANNTTLAYTASGLKANTSYKFRVGAFNESDTMIAHTDITAKTKGKVASVKSTVTNSGVKLTWDKYAAGSYYKIWIKQNGAWKLLKKTFNNTTLAYTASGLKANTSYTFRVGAFNASGTMTAYTDLATKTKGKVASVNSTVSNSSVKLTWGKYAAGSYYKVWVKQDGAWKLLTKTKNNTTITYLASGLKANTSYTFRVGAFNASGTMIAYTDVTAKTKAKVASVKSTTTNSGVKLTWGKCAAGSYYKVWVKQDGSWKLLTQTKNNTTLAYTANGLKANTSYTFRVTAYNSSGKAIAYTDITAKTKDKVASVKSTVTNSSVKLTWGKYAAASTYKIWVKQNGAWKLLKKTANNTTLTYTAKGLKANTSYKFRVGAFNASGTMIAYTDITAKTK